MMFFNWWVVGEAILALLMIGAGVGGFRKARRLPQRLARIGVRLISVPLAGVGTLLALLLFSATILVRMLGCQSNSAPIYSPSRDLVARVENSDEGATGGETYVVLYWAHGLRNKTVYFGPWASVEPNDVRWLSDSKLAIQYSYTVSGDGYFCKSTPNVSVTCSLQSRNK